MDLVMQFSVRYAGLFSEQGKTITEKYEYGIV